MTISQARMLHRAYPDMDGHRDTARLIVESLIDLGVAAGYFKRTPSPARRPETDAAVVVVPDTLIPELEAALAAQMQAKGWQPPHP